MLTTARVKLASSLLGLLVGLIPLRAAVPPYEAFVGTNGITITTPGTPPNRVVMIDGSAVAPAIATGQTLWVATNGNDGTAVRGRMDKPWQTVTNAALNLQNGDTIHIFSGNYGVRGRGEAQYTAYSDGTNAPILINNLTNITIEGDGPSSVLSWSGIGTAISVMNSHGITFRNFRIKGPGANLNNAAPKAWTNIYGAITLWSARASILPPGGTNDNIHFEGVHLEDIPDHGFVGVPDVQNFDITVVGNSFTRLGDAYHQTLVHDGACIASLGSRVVVSGNQANDVQHFVEVENSFGVPAGNMTDWTVVGNEAANIWRHGLAWWTGTTTGGPKLFNFSGNTLRQTPTNYPNIPSPQMINISANGQGGLIANNVISCPTGTGIAVSPSGGDLTKISIVGNTIEDANSSGIVAEGQGGFSLHDVLIEGNHIFSATDFAGITYGGSSGLIKGNFLADMAGAGSGNHGIWILKPATSPAATNNVISGNYFTKIQGTNIVIGAGATNTQIGINYTSPTTRRVNNAGTDTIRNGQWLDALDFWEPIQTRGIVNGNATGGGLTNHNSFYQDGQAHLVGLTFLRGLTVISSNVMIVSEGLLPGVSPVGQADFARGIHITNIANVSTNIVLTNVNEGFQWMAIKALPGSDVTIAGIGATGEGSWVHGFVPVIPTNGTWSIITIYRFGQTTNLTLMGGELSLASGWNLRSDTNYLTSALTLNHTNSTRFYTGVTTTNQIDFTEAAVHEWTNGLATNIVCQLTNKVGRRDLTLSFYGATFFGGAIASNYSVLIDYPVPGFIAWNTNCPTNGSFSFLVKSNESVQVSIYPPSDTTNYVRAAYAHFQ